MMRPRIIWLLGDGKLGHENQSLGLAEAICRRVGGEIHRVSLAGRNGLIGRFKAAASHAAHLPRPDVILAAGHATHLPLLWLTHKYRAKSIVLMRPSVPLSWFDLCIAPEHDFPEGSTHPNVILTRGALNRIIPSTGPKCGKLILIGGTSKTHGWDADVLLNMLVHITGDGSGWELTDSRRTPEGFLDELRTKLPGMVAISNRETPPDWILEKLRHAAEVWVTDDSISMVYEALTSGARVGLLPLPRQVSSSRVVRGIDCLVADGYLTTFAAWMASGSLAKPAGVLQEADRCAEVICGSMLNEIR